MATKSEIIVESNNTYVPNTSGLITPQLVQTLNTDWINASIFPEQTGSMSVKTAATASFLLGSVASASFSAFAVSASQSATASFAQTASFALNVPATSSFAISASFAQTASLATRNLITASVSSNIITFTKGDNTTFTITVAQSGSVTSASYADIANQANSASLATTASFAISSSRSISSLSASYAFTASSAITANTAVTATTATSALTSISASWASTAGTANTASYVQGYATLAGNNTFSGVTTFNNSVTMSNVNVTGTASIQFLNVVFESSSVIYASGSNILGDASNDTQTLWGTVNVISGPLVVTGSANFKETITGSISTAINANTASYHGVAFVSASQVGGNDKVSLTNQAGATTTLTIDNVSNANNAANATNATSASYAVTAGTTNNANTASYADNFKISGSLELTGSFSISSGSILMLASNAANNRGIRAMVTESLGSRSNIIGITLAAGTSTGSFVVSGSNNFVSLTAGGTNVTFTQGAAFGFTGTNSIITVLPTVTGSNGAANQRYLPSIANSNINQQFTVNDRRSNEITAPVAISTTSLFATTTISTNTGSYSISQAILGATGLQIDHTGSIADATTGAIATSIISGNGHNIKHVVSGSAGLNNSLVIGLQNRLLLSGSGTSGADISSTALLGNNLTITGSGIAAQGDYGTLIAGRWNNPIGNLGSAKDTVVAIGTGTGPSVRRTSLHISSSGLTTISNALNVTGSLNAVEITGSLFGTASFSQQSATASYFNGLVASASYAILAENANNAYTANVANSAISAQTATSASYALSASFASIAGSVTSASYANNATTANSATTATSASYAYTASSAISAGTASYAKNFIISGSQVITGSLVGQPVSQSVSSLTASLNLQAGNFFNLTLPASVNTYITASGQVDGQTINLKITQQATTGSVSLGAGFKQVSGSAYTVTATANAVDIVTFISFDNTGLYVSNVKNLI